MRTRPPNLGILDGAQFVLVAMLDTKIELYRIFAHLPSQHQYPAPSPLPLPPPCTLCVYIPGPSRHFSTDFASIVPLNHDLDHCPSSSKQKEARKLRGIEAN